MKKILLIDADSLCYIGTKEDSVIDLFSKVDTKILTILQRVNPDFYGLFISKGKYFRHNLKTKSEVTGSYKANRIYTRQKYNKVIKEYLEANYNAIYMHNIEADDYIKYLKNIPIYYYNKIINEDYSTAEFTTDPTANETTEQCECIVAAIDKDLLQSIEGTHLNYNKKVDGEWKIVTKTTTKEEANLFVWKQMILGDSADGVAGIKGKGKVWVKNNFKDITTDNAIYFVLKQYLDYYKDESTAIYEFQKAYRQLHLLTNESDYLREIGSIPEIPQFKTYSPETDVEEDVDLSSLVF